MADTLQRHQAFDRMSGGYDRRYTINPSMALMRRQVWGQLSKLIKPGQYILELGCGTGEDAVFLARQGCRVLATDCARAFLDITRQKAENNGVSDRIEVMQLDMENISALVSDYSGCFDGVLSDFGGLNTVENPLQLNTPLKHLIHPDGWFAACVMGRHCLWDYAVDVLQMKFNRLGKRRIKNGVNITVGPYSVQCFFPTPNEFIRAFPGFKLQSCRALGLLLPPPRLTAGLTGLHPLWELIQLAEQPIASIRLLSGLGDHFLVVMRIS